MEESVVIPEGSFVRAPTKWLFELGGDDLRRLLILHFRFKYFADQAFEEGRDVRKCYYESQQRMCTLFGMSHASRTKVGQFLKKMEAGGYITISRSKILIGGKLKPRHYIVVNDPELIFKYRI